VVLQMGYQLSEELAASTLKIGEVYPEDGSRM
jgi:hypothetical protein